MKKRIFALVLALAVCLGLPPGTAWAAGEEAPTVWCMWGRPVEQGLQMFDDPRDSIFNSVGNANGYYLLLSDPDNYGSMLTPTSVTVADPSIVTAALKTEWGATYIELTFLKEGETTLTATAGDVTYAPVAVYVGLEQGGGSGDEDFSVSQPAYVTVNDVRYTVGFASARGLFAGVSATRFSPNGEMDRGMVATVLCRLDGADLSMGASLNWAVEKGIVKGYRAVDVGLLRGKGNATLDPSGTATRAEVAAVIQRLVTWMTEK